MMTHAAGGRQCQQSRQATEDWHQGGSSTSQVLLPWSRFVCILAHAGKLPAYCNVRSSCFVHTMQSACCKVAIIAGSLGGKILERRWRMSFKHAVAASVCIW